LKLSYLFDCALAMLSIALVLAFLACAGHGGRLKAKSERMQGDSDADHHTSQKAGSSSFRSNSVAELEHLKSLAQAGVPKSVSTVLAMVLLALSDPVVAFNRSALPDAIQARARARGRMIYMHDVRTMEDGSKLTTATTEDGSTITTKIAVDESKTVTVSSIDGSHTSTQAAVDGSWTSTVNKADGRQIYIVSKADGSKTVQKKDAGGNIVTTDYAADGFVVQS